MIKCPEAFLVDTTCVCVWGGVLPEIEARDAAKHSIKHRTTPSIIWPRMSIVLRLKKACLKEVIDNFWFITLLSVSLEL